MSLNRCRPPRSRPLRRRRRAPFPSRSGPRRVALLALLALVAFAAPAGAAGARPIDLGAFSLLWTPVADGGRYAAYQPASGGTVIRDTLAHRSRQLALGPECFPGGVSGTQVIVNCRVSSPLRSTVLLANAATLSARTLIDEAGAFIGPYLDLGRYWAADRRVAARCTWCRVLYLNIRTAEQRLLIGARDLDRPGLPPRPLPTGYPQLLQPRVFTRGAALRVRLSRSRSVLLSTCPLGCKTAQLRGGYVAWSDSVGLLVHGYRIADRRRTTWRLPSQGGLRATFAFAIARGEVLAMLLAAPGSPTPPRRLYALPRPA